VKEIESGRFSLSAKAVAVGSAVVAVSSVATLAVVLATRNTDALVSTALALAILSFLVQVIFYVVQVSNANAQVRASEGINLRAQDALTEIVIRTSNVENAIGGQMGRAWDWFLSHQGAEVAKQETEEAAVATRRPTSEMRRPRSRQTELALYPQRRAEDLEILHRMNSSLPESALRKVKPIAERLSLTDQESLVSRLEDEREYREKNGTLGLPIGSDQAMVEAGLLERVVPSPYPKISSDWARLTPIGLDVSLYLRQVDQPVRPPRRASQHTAPVQSARRPGTSSPRTAEQAGVPHKPRGPRERGSSESP
jgi:hypothetical protein